MTVASLIQEYWSRLAYAIREKQYNEVVQLRKAYSDQVNALPAPEDEIAAKLACIARDIHMEHIQEWLVAADWHPSIKYLESLCSILENENAHAWHERVVDILYELEDARSIPSLAQALSYKASGDDPTWELAVKIIQTLDKIGGPEARKILERATQSPINRIREEATYWLTGQQPDDY